MTCVKKKWRILNPLIFISRKEQRRLFEAYAKPCGLQVKSNIALAPWREHL